jgi:hypothetical protein
MARMLSFEDWAEIQALFGEGRPIKEIARLTGWERNTVRRVTRASADRVWQQVAGEVEKALAALVTASDRAEKLKRGTTGLTAARVRSLARDLLREMKKAEEAIVKARQIPRRATPQRKRSASPRRAR